jgi:hypothetical protein
VNDDGVSAQVNVAASDLPFVEALLTHKIGVLDDVVDEFLVVMDGNISVGTRYDTAVADPVAAMRRILQRLAEQHHKLRVVEVDYNRQTAARLAEQWTGGVELPVKNVHGAPWYAYVFGLDCARYDLVLHLDADILCGGTVGSWLEQARRVLRDSRVLTVSPHGGPVSAPSDRATRRQGLNDHLVGHPAGSIGRAVALHDVAYRHFSTQVFMLRRSVLQRHGPVPVARYAGSKLRPRPASGVAPFEVAMSLLMRRERLQRRDFLGPPPGFWTLHPPRRSDSFLRSLPAIIAAVEREEVPAWQRGVGQLLADSFDAEDVPREPPSWAQLAWAMLRRPRVVVMGPLGDIRT